MTKRKRLWVVLLSAVAITVMVLLATSLSKLEFQPGHALPRREQAEDLEELVFGGFPDSEAFRYLVLGLYCLAALLLPLAVAYLIVSRRARKQMLRSLLFILTLLVLFLVVRERPELLEQPQTAVLATPAPGSGEVFTAEFEPNPPQWAVLLTTGGLAVLLAGLVVGAVWLIWRRGRRPESSLVQLGEEAREALHALQAGADLKDTVLRCYFEMERVLREQRGIEREEAMTPREFELSLAKAGLPDRHIEQLVRLFEGVRYGAKAVGKREELQAIDCLTAIVELCGNSP